MKIIHRLFVFVFFLLVGLSAWAQQGFDKAGYYEVMAADKIQALDTELDIVEKLPTISRNAYEGALLMKKAGFLKKAGDKLETFKAGRKKLESAIKAEPGNAEWRFLRLMIQENAPKAVNYKKDLQADSTMISNNANNLSPVVKKAISNYGKNSKILNSKDF